ncbi:MAG: DUF4955 domain-containing protein [Bacteroidota bacterium]
MEIDNIDVDLLAYESLGTKIEAPNSLFEAQLAHRLGAVPAWLTEQAALYEACSRYFQVQIDPDLNHTVYAPHESIDLKLFPHPKMDLSKITRVELLISDSIFDGAYTQLSKFDHWRPQLSTRISKEGTHLLRARLTNLRGEVTETDPISVYIGDPTALCSHPVVRATGMNGYERADLYPTLSGMGGGESQFIEPSAYDKHSLLELYQIEELYRRQLDTFTWAFGAQYVKPFFDDNNAIRYAERLIDEDPKTVHPGTGHVSASYLQFDLGETKTLNAIEFGFRVKPDDVQLDIWVSNDSNCWYSFVNDAMSWEFGVSRIGKSHIPAPLPGKTTARLYLPRRNARYVRLIMAKFRNSSLHTVKFLGKPECALAAPPPVEPDPRLRIAPNPSSRDVFLGVTVPWQLISINGKILETGESDHVNLRPHAKGIYFLRIRNEVFKVVKQ